MAEFTTERVTAVQRRDLEKLRELFMSPEAKEWDRTIIKAQVAQIIRTQTAKVKDGSFTDYIWSRQGSILRYGHYDALSNGSRTLLLALARLHDSGMEWVHPNDVAALVASKPTTIRHYFAWLAGKKDWAQDNNTLLWKKGERDKVYYRINMEGGEKW